MIIEKNKSEDAMEMKLLGWLDTESASKLEAELSILPDDVTSLSFDCADLEYISSSGLRQFVAAHKKMNGNLIVRNASSEIMNVVKMTGIDKKVKFE